MGYGGFAVKVNRVVYDFLDGLADGTTVSGWGLCEIINSKTGRCTYPSTLLDYCRDYCDITGGEWECVDKGKSIYKFHKGCVKLNGFVPNGRE